MIHYNVITYTEVSTLLSLQTVCFSIKFLC